MPFVEGRLRGEALTATVDSECAHCGQSIKMDVDSDVRSNVKTEGADPVVLIPAVDFSKLTERCITDVF